MRLSSTISGGFRFLALPYPGTLAVEYWRATRQGRCLILAAVKREWPQSSDHAYGWSAFATLLINHQGILKNEQLTYLA
jgi:hypothetical protein